MPVRDAKNEKFETAGPAKERIRAGVAARLETFGHSLSEIIRTNGLIASLSAAGAVGSMIEVAHVVLCIWSLFVLNGFLNRLPLCSTFLGLIAVSKLKTGRRTESRARAGSEIEYKTRVKIECGIGIRVESLIGIEIQKMKELFVPGSVYVRTVIGGGILIENGMGNGIENGNRITTESGTEIENGAGVENEREIGIRIKGVTGIGTESKTGLEIDIDRFKR
ncbi:hypothetical protein EVAR_90718_1 [Eumeta japonica]|uniref:Uncharacterized protein n=1 Tax=Eumeta variegata TaxID=151549 RepID=A0A4C1ZFU3_EUMVA|nr:hypothetical protein EVAR_90718_1 [Eumeta japonica]